MKKLKNKLKKILFFVGKNEIEEILKAFAYAERMHVGQKRVGGEPYINHLFRVAIALADYCFKNNTPNPKVSVISAILHDVVEDTEAALEDVRENFGEEVAKIVDSLSHTANPDGSVNEDEPDEVYLARVAGGGHIAIIIKRFDMLDNLSSVKETQKDFYDHCVKNYNGKLKIWGVIDPVGLPDVKKSFLKAIKDGYKK